MKTFVMGDIHGNYKGLLQCFEKSGFNKEEDVLIQLGDVADGWSEVYECVEELLTIKNLIAIKGNHDDWTLEMMTYGIHPGLNQGGKATLDSYMKHCYDSESYMSDGGIYFPENHVKFFKNQHNYYIDEQNRCFVHGGFNRHFSIKSQQVKDIYYWDRDLWYSALSFKSMNRGLVLPKYSKFKTKDDFEEIFIGHTTTQNWGTTEPINAVNVWNLDTGSGFNGKLTIMNIDTKEYWQSDYANILYSNEKGR